MAEQPTSLSREESPIYYFNVLFVKKIEYLLLLFNNIGNIYYYYLIIITNIQIFFITCKLSMRHNRRQFFYFVAELSNKIGDKIEFMRQNVLLLILSSNASVAK